MSQSRWPRGLRHSSVATGLLRLWVWISPGAWMFIWCDCCVLSGRDLCNKPITHPEESYQLWCVVVCDLETSWMRRPWSHWGGGAVVPKTNKQTLFYMIAEVYVILYFVISLMHLHYVFCSWYQGNAWHKCMKIESDSESKMVIFKWHFLLCLYVRMKYSGTSV
jgi:hypothetical protein